MLPQTKYKFKPYRGCRLVSGSEWDCAMLHLQCLVITLKRGDRFPMLYDLVVNVLQFCALQFTFTSLDRKSKLKSPKQDDYKEFGAWYCTSKVFVLVQGKKKKETNKEEKVVFSANVIILTSAEVLAQENSIQSSLCWLHYITGYALIST